MGQNEIAFNVKAFINLIDKEIQTAEKEKIKLQQDLNYYGDSVKKLKERKKWIINNIKTKNPKNVVLTKFEIIWAEYNMDIEIRNDIKYAKNCEDKIMLIDKKISQLKDLKKQS